MNSGSLLFYPNLPVDPDFEFQIPCGWLCFAQQNSKQNKKILCLNPSAAILGSVSSSPGHILGESMPKLSLMRGFKTLDQFQRSGLYAPGQGLSIGPPRCAV
jgi:hypothetical protein